MKREPASPGASDLPPVSLPEVKGIKDPAVIAARRLLRPEARAEEGKFLIEGEELLERALRESVKLDLAFLADAPGHSISSSLAARLREAGVETYRLSQGLLFKILGTSYETSTTALGVARRPSLLESDLPPASEGCLLAAGERIQDPRNVGVMIRTADAAGAPALILSGDSADPTSRPAVRSSTGSILSLPVIPSPDLFATLQRLQSRGYRIIGTSASAPQRLWEADLTGPCCLLFGNETEGLSPALRERSDLLIRIPMVGEAHSLNVTVASGIILYEAFRQRHSA